MPAALKLMPAEQIRGTHVVNPQGDDLGRIEDVVVETSTGHIVYAILSSGGFLGIGNKLFALPWDVLGYSTQHDAYVIDLPGDKLKNAPGFDTASPQDMADPRWAKPVHDYYGSKASWYMRTTV